MASGTVRVWMVAGASIAALALGACEQRTAEPQRDAGTTTAPASQPATTGGMGGMGMGDGGGTTMGGMDHDHEMMMRDGGAGMSMDGGMRMDGGMMMDAGTMRRR